MPGLTPAGPGPLSVTVARPGAGPGHASAPRPLLALPFNLKFKFPFNLKFNLNLSPVSRCRVSGESVVRVCRSGSATGSVKLNSRDVIRNEVSESLSWHSGTGTASFKLTLSLGLRVCSDSAEWHCQWHCHCHF